MLFTRLLMYNEQIIDLQTNECNIMIKLITQKVVHKTNIFKTFAAVYVHFPKISVL